jgi:hypothetical protein
MALHTIPIELRLVIAELLDPRACFKLALASRDDHNVYSSLLEKHKAFFARYGTIDTADAGRLLWDVTKELIETPQKAQYVEDISLPNTRQSVWEPDTDLDSWKYNCPILVPEAVVQLYTDAARKIPVMKEVLDGCRYDAHFYGQNWNFEQTIRIGSDEPIAALLIAMVPNLHTLRFTQFDQRNELSHLIRLIALAYTDPIKAPSLPLQNLTYVAVSYDDTENCCEPEWAELFISLPTLRGFAASKMGGSLEPWRDEYETDANLLQSNVKDMLFDRSFFAPETLEQIIGGTKALRSFVYDNGGFCISDEGCFASRRITAALLKHAANSLEELGFSGEYHDDDVSRADPLPQQTGGAKSLHSSLAKMISNPSPCAISQSCGPYDAAGEPSQAKTPRTTLMPKNYLTANSTPKKRLLQDGMRILLIVCPPLLRYCISRLNLMIPTKATGTPSSA